MAIKKYNNLLNNTVSDSTKTKKLNTAQDKLLKRVEDRKKLDSISSIKRSEILRKKDSIINRNANARGMDKETYNKTIRQESKKPDAKNCNLNDPSFKSTKCGISKKAAKKSKSDFKKA
jgi:hypothetical protein